MFMTKKRMERMLIPTPSPSHRHSKLGRWEIVHSLSLQDFVEESLRRFVLEQCSSNCFAPVAAKRFCKAPYVKLIPKTFHPRFK